MKQHASGFLELVNRAKQHINEITAEELQQKLQQQSVTLIDVREAAEWPTGHIPGAIHLSKGIIERDIEKKIPDLNTPVVVYCSGGFRCALVADNLQQMGYTEVYSLDNGLQGWIEAGFRIEQ